jgi:GGDEF domain-containing protein
MYPAQGTTAKALLDASDRALYVSKTLGKNRSSFAQA